MEIFWNLASNPSILWRKSFNFYGKPLKFDGNKLFWARKSFVLERKCFDFLRKSISLGMVNFDFQWKSIKGNPLTWKGNPLTWKGNPLVLNRKSLIWPGNLLVLERRPIDSRWNPLVLKETIDLLEEILWFGKETHTLWMEIHWFSIGRGILWFSTEIHWFGNGNFLTTFHDISVRRTFCVILLQNFPQRMVLTLCQWLVT